jgi:hypothetical protein
MVAIVSSNTSPFFALESDCEEDKRRDEEKVGKQKRPLKLW